MPLLFSFHIFEKEMRQRSTHKAGKYLVHIVRAKIKFEQIHLLYSTNFVLAHFVVGLSDCDMGCVHFQMFFFSYPKLKTYVMSTFSFAHWCIGIGLSLIHI